MVDKIKLPEKTIDGGLWRRSHKDNNNNNNNNAATSTKLFIHSRGNNRMWEFLCGFVASSIHISFFSGSYFFFRIFSVSYETRIPRPIECCARPQNRIQNRPRRRLFGARVCIFARAYMCNIVPSLNSNENRVSIINLFSVLNMQPYANILVYRTLRTLHYNSD